MNVENFLNQLSHFMIRQGITINEIVLILILFLFVAGVRNIYLYATRNKTKKPKSIKNKRLKQLLEGFQSDHDSELFLALGIKINIEKYKSIRITAIIVMIVMALLSVVQGKPITVWAIMIGFITYATYPKDLLFGKKTPFKWFMEKAKMNYLKKRDEELSRIITQLKNLIVAQKENPWSADYTIETLMRFSDMTKPIFSQTLRLHREGRVREACEYFANASGTRLGRDFSMILLKLDELNPNEFFHQLIMFKADIQAKKQTERLKKQKSLGSFVFLAVMVVCGLIIMDGMYIIMLQDALSRLQMV